MRSSRDSAAPGKLFAFEHEAIRPDGVTVGKALSGGFYPVSAFLARDEVMNVFTPGIHGSTYGGNPLACAVAIAALDVLVEERLVERAAELGVHLDARLKAMRSPLLKETRCRGLWAGVELVPEAGGARKYCDALKDRGLLCKDTHVNTIRIAPPLVITREQLDWAVDQIEACCERHAGRPIPRGVATARIGLRHSPVDPRLQLSDGSGVGRWLPSRRPQVNRRCVFPPRCDDRRMVVEPAPRVGHGTAAVQRTSATGAAALRRARFFSAAVSDIKIVNGCQDRRPRSGERAA